MMKRFTMLCKIARLLTVTTSIVWCFIASGQELNTILMNSTFKVVGPSATVPGNTNFGTVFIMGKPIKERPGQGYLILITAAHVFDEIAGEQAVLQLRRRDANGLVNSFGFPIQIRNGTVNIYKSPPDADVAAMYVRLPKDIEIRSLSVETLADDATLERLQVHPGDELFCLGFPLGVDLGGFPILRTGTLASYPITPSKQVKKYFYDFHVFPGNSGGPVYYSFANRPVMGGSMRLGSLDQGVIGVVVEQVNSVLPEYKDLPLDVSRVVPSPYIRDAIALLPDEPVDKSSLDRNQGLVADTRPSLVH